MGPRNRAKKAEGYKVRSAFVAVVLTHWRAPFTGGDEKLLPVGLEFTIEDDALPHATAAVALPDPYAEWERRLVSKVDRGADKYGGYSVVIPFDLLAEHCENVGTESGRGPDDRP